MDPASVGVVFGGINKGIDVIKKLRSIDLKIQTAEYKDALAELLNNMADLKVEFAKLQEENLRLQQMISGSDPKMELRKALKKNHHGWAELKETIQGHEPGKYCSLCFEKHSLMILMEFNVDEYQTKSYYCSNCKETRYDT